MRWRIVLSMVLVAAVGCVFGASAGGSTRTVGLPHVTLIGDSVADAIPGDSKAVAILRQGIDLDLEVEACRRVDQQSCPGAGGMAPPNMVQLVNSMGSKLGPNVVVEVGYNDFADQYAQNLQTALTALEAAGVQHVWWLTLREAHHPYIGMNDEITSAVQQHPELRVIDWNVYSRSHANWFQSDGIHLLAPGSEAMAGLIHQTLLDSGIALKPVRVTTTVLPVAHRGKPYSARLSATSGLAPYAWSLLERAPKGLHLEASGAILGEPRVTPGTYVLNVQVKDAGNSLGTRRLVLHVTR